jgi:polyketide cyclase/dehydrase/lipid transport protein
MTHFTTRTTTSASPEQVLDVLTDPDAIREWAPIPFEVEELDGYRLEAGSCARVTGGIAGLKLGFDLEVHAADEDGLELTAEGPIGIDVRYDLAPVDDGAEVHASVSVRGGGGITGRLAAKATAALLAAGALDGAAGRIARAAETGPAFALAA